MQPLLFDEARPVRMPILCRYENHHPFAYVRGTEVHRLSDGEMWAYLSDGELRTARSGTAFAYQDGVTFYEVATGEPLYYQAR